MVQTGISDAEKSRQRRFWLVMILLVCLLLAGLVINANTGSAAIQPEDVFRMIFDAVRLGLGNLFRGGRYAEEFTFRLRIFRL